MCYSGVWGTVCSDLWGTADASVVCRQLGYSSSGAISRINAAYGQGTGPIFLEDVMCTGLEYRLIECPSRGIEVSSCIHTQDAGVICVAGCTEGEVRLVGGTDNNEGRVEICFSNMWGTVCDNMWDATDAMVTCRQLGLGTTGAQALTQATFGMGTGSVLLDGVQCTGSERVLMNCTASSSVSSSCTHARDAGVRCSSGCHEGDVRLLEGSTRLEGRVEVCRTNRWGTVCDDGWGKVDATVVCRQLGFSVAASIATTSATFGQGTGLIVMGNVGCRGTEARLIDCSSSSFSCSHSEDAGVRCQAQTDCSEGSIRLVGGQNSLEGRVEVCYSGVWGTVCSTGWGTPDSTVVCRQLGYSPLSPTFLRPPTIPAGSGVIFLDNVACTGLERRLFDCPHSGFETNGCSHSQDVGVQCSSQGCTSGDVRLVGGANDTQGRVEFCLNNEWGTVCDQMWDTDDARVVCRQLGLGTSAGVEALSQATFGRGTGIVWLNAVQCTGNESTLMSCPADSDGTNSCTHAQDAGVICPAVCTEGIVRLLGGATNLEGRVEVCRNGEWGTVCDNGWGKPDATVVCRQLGFSVAGSAATTQATFGQGTGTIALSTVACTGTELRLVDCSSGAVTSCTHSEDAGVRCLPQTDCSEGSIRLVGGQSSLEGRVEACYSGVWGTVCSAGWDASDSAVVCRQLGYSVVGSTILTTPMISGGSGPIFLDNVVCTGLEARLFDCPHGGFETNSCSHSQDVGVRCSSQVVCNDGDIRLMSGVDRFEGRVEICYGETWGTVCDDLWSSEDASVVCRELGLPTSGASALLGAHFGQGSGPVFLSRIQCIGTENRLSQCPNPGLNVIGQCAGHSNDAGVRCLRAAPSNVQVEGAGSSLSIRWSAPVQHTSTIIAYRVTCTSLGQQDLERVLGEDAVMTTFRSLPFNLQYSCCVEVGYNDSSSNTSTCATGRTGEGVSGAPAALTAMPSVTNCASVTLMWSPPPRDQQNGVTVGYTVNVTGMSGLLISSRVTGEELVVDSLACCSNYSFTVVARTGAGEGAASEAFSFSTNAQYEDILSVRTMEGSNYIVVMWSSNSPASQQQQLRSVHVMLTSVCPTQILPSMTRLSTTLQLPDQGSSFNITELDPFQPYQLQVSATICQRTLELFNETITIEDADEVTRPSLSNVTRSLPTSASVSYSLGSSINGASVTEISLYDNINNNFDVDNPVQTVVADASVVVISSLAPCSTYWVVVNSRDCRNSAASVPALIGRYEPMAQGLVVSVVTTSDNIVVTWNADSSRAVQQQLQSVEVVVTSVCNSGDVAAQSPQVFTVSPDQGNSATAMVSDPFVPYRIQVTATLCDSSFNIYNETVIIQEGGGTETPTFRNIVRSSPTIIDFSLTREAGVTFEVSYYTNIGNSFDENFLVRSFPIANPDGVTIDGLNPCLSYWVVVTASSCRGSVRSSPQLVAVFDSLRFKFTIELEGDPNSGANTLCRVWIADDFARKISDVQNLLNSELEASPSCGVTTPCMADSEFTCGDDSSLISYETVLVGTQSLSSRQQRECLEQWISSQAEVEIAGVAARITATSTPATSGTSQATEEVTPSTPGPQPTPVYVWPIIVIAAVGVLVAVILAVVVIATRSRRKSRRWVLKDNSDDCSDEDHCTVTNPVFTDAATFPSELTISDEHKKKEDLKEDYSTPY